MIVNLEKKNVFKVYNIEDLEYCENDFGVNFYWLWWKWLKTSDCALCGSNLYIIIENRGTVPQVTFNFSWDDSRDGLDKTRADHGFCWDVSEKNSASE